MISDMAGNAYSCFNYVPFLCSLLSTAGRFASGDKAEEEDSGNKQNDSGEDDFNEESERDFSTNGDDAAVEQYLGFP